MAAKKTFGSWEYIWRVSPMYGHPIVPGGSFALFWGSFFSPRRKIYENIIVRRKMKTQKKAPHISISEWSLPLYIYTHTHTSRDELAPVSFLTKCRIRYLCNLYATHRGSNEVYIEAQVPAKHWIVTWNVRVEWSEFRHRNEQEHVANLLKILNARKTWW